MTKKADPESAPAPAPMPTPPPTPQQRAAACAEEVAQVLARHRCRIVPFLLNPEPVGTDGARAIIAASFGIQAD